MEFEILRNRVSKLESLLAQLAKFTGFNPHPQQDEIIVADFPDRTTTTTTTGKRRRRKHPSQNVPQEEEEADGIVFKMELEDGGGDGAELMEDFVEEFDGILGADVDNENDLNFYDGVGVDPLGNSGIKPLQKSPFASIATLPEKPTTASPSVNRYATPNRLMKGPRTTIKTKNNIPKPFLCDECPATFAQESYLKTHLVRHKNERNFQCSYCPARFNQSGDVRKHEKRKHSVKGEKNPRHFYVNQDKKRVRVRKIPETAQCYFCLKICNDGSILVDHLRTHTGERPYECKECGMCVAHRATLRMHLIRTGHRN